MLSIWTSPMFYCWVKSEVYAGLLQIDDLVLVDIDLGEVTMNSISTRSDNEVSVPCLPKDATKMFMDVSPQFRLVFDAELLKR